MITVFYLVVALFALVALYAAIRAVIRVLEYRGKRVITCPETGAPAAVEVDARHAAITSILGGPDLRLNDCSRWPERQGCGQECLRQIERAPMECLARTILARWYEGKACALCGRGFGEINWHDHKPALMSPERKLVEWPEVSPEKIPEALATHLPVCWNCHVAETFRDQHPELAVDRPWRGKVQVEKR